MILNFDGINKNLNKINTKTNSKSHLDMCDSSYFNRYARIAIVYTRICMHAAHHIRAK